MQISHDQRKEIRLKYKNTIQYEEYLDDGRFGIPVATSTFDISAKGVGFYANFYANKEFKLQSQLKITCKVSDKETISFMASVVRLQLNNEKNRQYIIGVQIIDITDENKEKLNVFLSEGNISHLLDTIDLDQVMDIHFIPGHPIFLKKNGKLKTIGNVLDEFKIRNLLLNLLDDDSYAKFMRIRDINFVIVYKNKRLRFNMHFQQQKIEAVCRVVKSKIPTIAQLGLPPITERLVKNNSRGLILISGRTGSGKSTTLASLIKYLSKTINGVIISVEDPIEYVQEKSECIVKQRELGDDTISYASALRNALRQNPDVLIIGETVDKETMELVLTAAELGILVLTTIHSATTVSQVLDRTVSFFPVEAQKQALTRLSLSLRGVIVQDLFPRIKGDEGLALAAEVFLVNEISKKIIRDGDWKQIPDIMLRGKSQGMVTMKDSIEDLVHKGIIDRNYLNEYTKIFNS